MKAHTTQVNLRPFWTFARVLTIGFVALLWLLGIEASSIPQVYSKPAMPTLRPIIISTTPPAVSVSLAQQYMEALLQQKYAVMWSMLHPQIQAMWPDQRTFGHYLQMRFEDYTLQSFSCG